MIKTKDGVYIIGIDHGYGNIKTANTVTPTGITAYDSEPTFTGNVLESGGVYFTIGEGHKPYIINKAEDEDYFHLTQYAIARELAREGVFEADVHIAAGLPLTWVRAQRDSFREYLMQQESMEFTLNKKHFTVRIVGCNVYPQGYPAIINKLSEMNGTTMLADIGNGTMNIMYFLNRRPIESKCYTEKMGVNQCLIAAKNEVMNRYGVTIDDTIIEQIIRTGNVECRVAGNTVSYRHPEYRDKNGQLVSIRGSKLGKRYTKGGIEDVIKTSGRAFFQNADKTLRRAFDKPCVYADGEGGRGGERQRSGDIDSGGNRAVQDTAGLFAGYAQKVRRTERESAQTHKPAKRV